MYYEINVSKNGRHFFATAERSIRDEDRAREAVAIFREKFPESEGYSVSCTRYQTVGHAEDFPELTAATKLFYAETSFGAAIVEAGDLSVAKDSIMKRYGTTCGIGKIREASDEDVAWVKAMGGHVPEVKS